MISAVNLENKFSEVIDILRKKYDLVESLDCGLKLFLFKRLSDQSHRETITQFSLPKEANWSVIEKEQYDLSEKISQALNLIETVNPKIKGVFIYSKINFWNRFDDETLRNVIGLISKLDLSDKNFNDLNDLGKAFESFIEQKASIESDKKRIYAPRQLIKMMIELTNPQQETKIYDPVCGSGGFLIEFANFVKERGGNLSQLNLSGQEEDAKLYATAKANLILNGIYDSDIRVGNAILENCSSQSDKPKLFDLVLANPPFNFKFQLEDLKDIDCLHQFPYGIPRNGNGDYLFIQHILSSLGKEGKAAVILPRGILFREGDEEIRQNIIKDDLIEAVIEIAPKLFYNASIPVVIVIFNRNKSNKKKILFIDASHEYEAKRGQNFLDDKHISHIVSAYHEFKDEKGFAKLVTVEEVAKNKYNLSVDSYVIPCVDEKIDLDFEVSKLHQLEAERFEIERKIDHYLRALGINL